MTKISTRDALLALRHFQTEDAESADAISDLQRQLNDALEVRAGRLADALLTLEGYVAYQSEVHGFSNALESLVAETKSGPVAVRRKKKATKKTAKKKRSKKRPVRRKTKGHSGWRGKLDETINLSEKEQICFNLLSERSPDFFTADEFVAAGAAGNRSHIAPLIVRMRKKGVPIESATQARKDGHAVSLDTSGYRLIG